MTVSPLRFGKNVLDALEIATGKSPLISTERGELFALDDLPVGAIRLKVSLEEYFAWLAAREEGARPDTKTIVPVEGQSFHIVVNGAVVIADGKALIAGGASEIL